MSRVFIGVGSNEGERLEHISKALRLLRTTKGIRIVQMAAIIETSPVGGPPQGRYLNTALELETALSPIELLDRLQQIERQLGRKAAVERWSARPIDLDILLYDNLIVSEPRLSIPHPRLHERHFVLYPLAQLAPDVRHPINGETISSLLERLSIAA